MSRAAKLALPFLLSLALASAALAVEVIERYDDGLIKVKYNTNRDGRKDGPYLEYYPKGKFKLRCSYKADQFDGPWTSYYESGAVHIKTAYAAGQLHGPYLETDEKGKILKEQAFSNGLLLYPRSQRLINATLAEIGIKPADHPASGRPPTRIVTSATAAVRNNPASDQPAAISGEAGLTDPANLDALKRLNAYRYLVGLPWDVTLKADYCEKCQIAARLLQSLGHIEHFPPNNGLSEADYAKALGATTNGNLSQGRGTRASVDGYMNDSDPSNIDRVGHRRWCLNPVLLQAGFGEAGSISVMYSHDQSRKGVPDYDYVAFPVPGYMPTAFFGPNYAWHVSVNPLKYRRPAADVKAVIYPLPPSGDGVPDPKKRGPALELNYFNIETSGYGINNAIIFRPKGLALTGPQTRYWVEITGLKKTDGSDARIEYLVDFYTP
jgi:hypothetical protein